MSLIGCRNCNESDCKGCNLYILEKMLYSGKLDRIMNENHTIQESTEVRSFLRGRWLDMPTGRYGQIQSWCPVCGKKSGVGGNEKSRHKTWCPNCGAFMKESIEVGT